MYKQVQGAVGGAILGAAMLSWYPDPYRVDSRGVTVPKPQDLAYVLRHLKLPVAWGALACTTYSGVECVMEQLRDESKSSTWLNSAVGGAATGILLGSMTKRIDYMAASGLGMGLLMGLLEYGEWAAVAAADAAKKSTPLSNTTTNPVTVASLKEKYPEFKDL